MRTTLAAYMALGLACLPAALRAQYYLTGTTRLDSARVLPFVQMRLHSTGRVYQSGSTGDFGIPTRLRTDTVTCTLRGHDTLVAVLEHGRANLLTLKPDSMTLARMKQKGRLQNLVPNLPPLDKTVYQETGETYANLVENPWIATRAYPRSGFSPTTNKAAYANVRRFLQTGQRVPPEAVRLEELVNYFALPVSKPPADSLFSFHSRLTSSPWNPKRHLLFVHMHTRPLDLSQVPPANLVFLIDNSGSMDMPNRLPLLKTAFRMLVHTLRDIDRVAIVTYGGMAGVALEPTMGSEKDKILAAINALEAAGATAGSEGIKLAYRLATTQPMPNANNRVILATDGDFNVGATSEKELEELIGRYRNTGVTLTCLGVGMGNYKDSKIETLARHGNGNFAYLDSEEEAQKVLVTELTQHLYSVATEVTAHIELNPQMVKQYRLVGYDNRREALLEDGQQLIGSELGAGFPLTAIYEVELAEVTPGYALGEAPGLIRVRYLPTTALDVDPGPTREMTHRLPDAITRWEEIEPAYRFAAAATMFGGWLRRSPFITGFGLADVRKVLEESLDPDHWAYRELAATLEKAEKLYRQSPKPPRRKPKGG